MDSNTVKLPRAENLIDYPKTYRPSLALRLFLVIVAIAFCGVAVLLVASSKGNQSAYLPSAFLVGTGVLMAAVVLAAKVTLYQDYVIQSSLFATIKLYRQDIRGYRSRAVKNATYVDLLPVNDQLKKISVAQAYIKDPVFGVWLQKIPNLDEEVQRAVYLEIEQDESLGRTPEERRAKVQLLRKVGNYVTYGYMAAAVGIGIYPHPLWLAVLIPIIGPWIAIGMVSVSGRNFTMLDTDKAVLLRKGNLIQLLVFPALSFYLMFKIEGNGVPSLPMDWQTLLIVSVIGGLAMGALVWSVSSGAKMAMPKMLGMLIPLAGYVGGAVTMANGIFDHMEAKSYTLIVLKKYRTTGKGAANYLTVSSPDPSYRGATSIRVPYNIYNASSVNSVVCAQIHPGALGLQWESIGLCGPNESNIVGNPVSANSSGPIEVQSSSATAAKTPAPIAPASQPNLAPAISQPSSQSVAPAHSGVILPGGTLGDIQASFPGRPNPVVFNRERPRLPNSATSPTLDGSTGKSCVSSYS